MKQCPTCRTTYTDETLRFCLADGAPLTDVGEQATVVRQSGGGPTAEKTVALGGGQMRVDIPEDAPPPQFHSQPPSSASGSGGLLKVLLIILGLGILIVLIALIGTVAYYNMRSEKVAGPGNDVKMPAASPAPTTGGNDDLRDQVANLQKQLAEQKNANRPSAPMATPNLSSTTMTKTARANSPADGFLALRTLPSATTGDRILKIPHGATVSVGACGPVERSVHPGRWCQARYNGSSGYVYDYYLIY
jgi:hypothetical protein